MSETADTRRARPAPLLPPDRGRDRPLFAVAAILVFLASLAALGAIGAWSAAANWSAQLAAEATVQVLPAEGRDADADARAAAESLANLPGVIAAEARDRAASEALLEPWLGRGALPDDLPVPRLVAVRLDPVRPPADGAIEALLSDGGYEVVVDDHGRWDDAVRRAGGAIRAFALGLVLLLTLAAGAVIAFAARASLAARWDVADALHLVGAPDGYVTGLFQRRFFLLGVKAGLVGAAAASTAAFALSQAGGAAGAAFFLPRFALDWTALGLPVGAALAAGLVSALAARLAVTAELKGRWR